MAASGTSALAPVAPITVTQTAGYDWTLSVRKAVHTYAGAAFAAVAAVLAVCLQSDEVRAALLASLPSWAGMLGKAALAALIPAAVKFIENWQKHRHDVPVQITAVPLVELGK